MAYAYASKEEEDYYTQWIKDIKSEAFNEGEKIGFAKGEKIGFAKGEKIGFAKGEKIGFTKGEKIGFAKGANSARKQIAQKLASMGVDTNILMDVFGLTPKEMQDILREKS